MSSLGSRLVQSATEALAIAKGEADPSTFRIYVPSDVDVRAIRLGQKLTQAEFAARYGFPLGTLRDLEQRRAKPDASTRAYLLVIAREPQAVQRALDHTHVEHASELEPA